MKYNPDIHHRRSIRLRGYDYSREGAYFITICVQNRQCIFGHIENKTMILNELGQIAYWEWEKLPQRWPHIELGAFQIMPNHMHGIIIINDGPVGAPLAGAPTDAGANASAGANAGTSAGANAGTSAGANAGTGAGANAGTGAGANAGAETATNGVPARGAPTDADTQNDVDTDIRGTQIQWAQKPTVGQIVGAYKSLVATECLKQVVSKNTGIHLGKLWQRNFWENIIRDLGSFDKISNYIIHNPDNWENDKFFGRE